MERLDVDITSGIPHCIMSSMLGRADGRVSSHHVFVKQDGTYSLPTIGVLYNTRVGTPDRHLQLRTSMIRTLRSLSLGCEYTQPLWSWNVLSLPPQTCK